MQITTTLQLYVEFHAKPERLSDVEQIVETFAKKTREEPGCDRIEVFRRTDEPETFVALMAFQDEAALQAHLDAEWRKDIAFQSPELMEGEFRRFTMQRMC